MSFPGVEIQTKRSSWVKVEAYDPTGVLFQLDASGIAAKCLQHEIDHLNGELFTKFLSRLKRDMLKKKILKARKKR